MKRLIGFFFPIIFITILSVNLTACSQTDFFRNQTITIIIPNGPGGGIDTYARTIAPFLQKYLPQSKVVVTNVTEKGGLAGKNQVYQAQPDGLTLGFDHISSALLAEWEGAPGVAYKTADFSYIGRINFESHVLAVSPKSGLNNMQDIVKSKKIKMGFSGVGTNDYYVAMITAHVLGYEVEPQRNFLSASDASFACVKGSVDGILFSDSSIHAQMDENTIKPVVVFSQSRLASLPQVPTIFEVVPSEKHAMVQTLVQIYALDRTMFGPPGMDPSRLKALRKAFDQAVNDPDFLNTLFILNRPVNYLNGTDVEELIKKIYSNENEIKPLVQMISKGSP